MTSITFVTQLEDITLTNFAWSVLFGPNSVRMMMGEIDNMVAPDAVTMVRKESSQNSTFDVICHDNFIHLII